MRPIIIACAGTGGHFYPGLALAQYAKKQNIKCILQLSGKFKKKQILLCQKLGINYHQSFSTPLPKNKIFYPLSLIAFTFSSFYDCLYLLKKRPQFVLSMGSFFNAPICMASILTKKKLYLHEANSILGKSHKIFKKFSKNTFSFLLDNNKIKVMPLRESFFKQYNKKEILTEYQLSEKKITILIFTGSQGAKNINHDIATQLTKLKNKQQYQIIHITGKQRYQENISHIYHDNEISHLTLDYCENIAKLYTISDLCISRAGASSIAELVYFKKPSLLIPYPYANGNHQEINISTLQKIVPKHYKKILEKDIKKQLIHSINNIQKITSTYPDLDIDFYGQTIFSYNKQ